MMVHPFLRSLYYDIPVDSESTDEEGKWLPNGINEVAKYVNTGSTDAMLKQNQNNTTYVRYNIWLDRIREFDFFLCSLPEFKWNDYI